MIKTSVFTCLSLVIVLFVNAQNVRLSSQSVSNERNRILYVGIENVFIVTDTTTNGIEKQDHVELVGNKLVIKPVTTGYFTVVFLKKDEKAQVIFYVKNIPAIMPAPGNQPGPKIRKDSLVANPFLGYATSDKNDGYFQGYEVKSFTAILKGQTFAVTGKDFPDPLKTAIQQSKPGDKLQIKDFELFNEKLKKSAKSGGGTASFTIE
jgi:hypothetical protein